MNLDFRNITLTYRARRRIKRTVTVVGSLLLTATVIWVCWFVWLERFVVYTGDGVRLDFHYVSPEGEPELAQPATQETVDIYYNEGTGILDISTELGPVKGYHVTYEMYKQGSDKIRQAIQNLPAGSAVMLDLKSGSGNFYYSSALPDATVTRGIDVTQVDSLIRDLAEGDIYLIARISGLRDYAYGLEHVNQGLPTAEGYLWFDEDHYYWLNPASSGAQSWLISIANELRALGFHEVVFTDFEFPEAEQIVFDSEMTREDALATAAQTLVDTCATTRFAVSFESDDPAFRLPQGRSRLYLSNAAAEQLPAVVAGVTVPDLTVNLVLTTDTNDTRFDAYNVIRPLPMVG